MSVDYKPAGLTIEPLGSATTIEEAWKLLPAAGSGVVVLADDIVRFDPAKRTGPLLEADVTDGASTVVLRQDGSQWRAWRWVEGPGDSHRYREHEYLSSEATDNRLLIYRQYWERVADDGLMIWTPVGARFCGFKEDN